MATRPRAPAWPACSLARRTSTPWSSACPPPCRHAGPGPEPAAPAAPAASVAAAHAMPELADAARDGGGRSGRSLRVGSATLPRSTRHRAARCRAPRRPLEDHPQLISSACPLRALAGVHEPAEQLPGLARRLPAERHARRHRPGRVGRLGGGRGGAAAADYLQHAQRARRGRGPQPRAGLRVRVQCSRACVRLRARLALGTSGWSGL